MDSRYRKRARLDAVVVVVGADRLSDLPDCLLTDHILSRLGSRQAVQTSALSRRWRSLWRSVPCLDLDQREFNGGSSWPKFEAFANAMLAATATTAAPPLDEFRLRVFGTNDNLVTLLPRGLGRFPAAADLRTGSLVPFNLAWPPLPKLGPATGTRRLTRLRLAGVRLGRRFGERLGEQCPVLEHLHLDRCSDVLRDINSPTLRSLAVAGRYPYCGGGAGLVRAAPRLASLRLDITYDGLIIGYEVPPTELEALPSLVHASVRITDDPDPVRPGHKRRELEFFKSMSGLLPRLSNATNLYLSGFTTAALLDEKSQEFPVFHNLKTLHLDKCDVGVNYHALTSILSNTANLEKLTLKACKFLGKPKRRARKNTEPKRTPPKRSSPLQCNNLQSVDIVVCHFTDALRLTNLFLENVKSMMQEEMPLSQWYLVSRFSNEDMTVVRLFKRAVTTMHATVQNLVMMSIPRK